MNDNVEAEDLEPKADLTKKDLEAWIFNRCARENLKLTAPRKTIIDVLISHQDHPDVEMIYQRASQQDAQISIATVYRTVKSLEAIAVLLRHEFGDGRARYELAIRQHHDHLIDIDSGEVIEFCDPAIEELQDKIAKKLGYRLTGHRLDLYGKKLSSKP